MTNKSFYDEKDPNEAMRIYLAQRAELYERKKVTVIKEVLMNVYGGGGLAGKSVLEIGAVGGNFAEWFLSQGARVTCIDICEPILQKSQQLYGDATFIVGDATRIEIPNGANSFDLVFAKDVIEHIAEDNIFLQNMFRHVKPGGTIV